MKALVPEWAALWSRCGSATPFQTPEWLLPWWRLFGQPRLWVLGVHAGPELIGLAPLFVQENGKQRVVRFLGTGISDYADFLLASDFSPVAMDSICDFLGKKRESWDMCGFENGPVEAPRLTMSAPPAFGRPAFKFRHMPSAKCPIIVLPKTGEDWFQHLSYKTRRNLMHTRNVLASAGACFEKATQESLEEYL